MTVRQYFMVAIVLYVATLVCGILTIIYGSGWGFVSAVCFVLALHAETRGRMRQLEENLREFAEYVNETLNMFDGAINSLNEINVYMQACVDRLLLKGDDDLDDGLH